MQEEIITPILYFLFEYVFILFVIYGCLKVFKFFINKTTSLKIERDKYWRGENI